MSVERHINIEVTPWTGEHLHRYNEAVKYISESDTVLDLACGSGYGTEILNRIKNTRVYGGDIDPETISQCKTQFRINKSLHFEIMDATELRFTDDFFDKIVSLETIEHLTSYKQMLAEFSRVLKADGTMILSTPNIKISSPTGKIINPFHTQEFTYDELKELLQNHFTDVTILGQKYARYYGNNRPVAMQILEKLLLSRGVRKLPYKLRNQVFQKSFRCSLYPTENDCRLYADKETIEKNCHVLFAICKK